MEGLLRHKPDFQINDQFGNSLLHYAALYGNDKIIDQILKCDYELNMTNDNLLEPFHAAILSDSINTFLKLVQYRKKIGNFENIFLQKTKFGFNCLHLAVKNNARKIFQYLMDQMDDYDQADNEFRSALMLSIAEGNLDFTHTLINRGADLSHLDIKGNNLLSYTAMYGEYQLFNVYNIRL